MGMARLLKAVQAVPSRVETIALVVRASEKDFWRINSNMQHSTFGGTRSTYDCSQRRRVAVSAAGKGALRIAQIKRFIRRAFSRIDTICNQPVKLFNNHQIDCCDLAVCI